MNTVQEGESLDLPSSRVKLEGLKLSKENMDTAQCLLKDLDGKLTFSPLNHPYY